MAENINEWTITGNFGTLYADPKGMGEDRVSAPLPGNTQVQNY